MFWFGFNDPFTFHASVENTLLKFAVALFFSSSNFLFFGEFKQTKKKTTTKPKLLKKYTLFWQLGQCL